MAFVTHTVTGDLRQMFGDAINVASTNGFVETNLANDQTLVYDLDNGVQLLGTGRLEINSDGTWSLTGVPSWDNTEADQNPTHVQVQIVFEYVDPLARRKLVWRSGYLQIDHDGSIGEFAAQQLAPADWRSDFMDTAEGLLAQQQVISGLTGEDAAMANIAANPASDFRGELEATIGAIKAWAKNPDNLVVGALTYSSGLLATAAVVWPDGATGTMTIASRDASGNILSYAITRVTGTGTATYTQPTITRDSSGLPTSVPQIVVS